MFTTTVVEIARLLQNDHVGLFVAYITSASPRGSWAVTSGTQLKVDCVA